MPGACVSTRGRGMLCGLAMVTVITLGIAVGIADGANPPNTAYMEPHPIPLADDAAKAFVDRVSPDLQRLTTDELARGVVVVPVTRGSSGEDGQLTVQPPVRRQTPDEGEEISAELLGRAGVGTSRGGIDALWVVLLAGLLAVGGLAGRFVVDRRTSSTTE